jgi:hypothetical protein
VCTASASVAAAATSKPEPDICASSTVTGVGKGQNHAARPGRRAMEPTSPERWTPMIAGCGNASG